MEEHIPDMSGGLCECSLCKKDKRIRELDAEIAVSKANLSNMTNEADEAHKENARLRRLLKPHYTSEAIEAALKEE